VRGAESGRDSIKKRYLTKLATKLEKEFIENAAKAFSGSKQEQEEKYMEKVGQLTRRV